MALLRKKRGPPSRLKRRAAGLPLSELPAWADQCLYGAGTTLERWGRDRQPHLLHEAEMAAWALLVVIQEIKRREGVEPVSEVELPTGL